MPDRYAERRQQVMVRLTAEQLAIVDEWAEILNLTRSDALRDMLRTSLISRSESREMLARWDKR